MSGSLTFVVKDAHILILGITFKENCPDIRNTKVLDIYQTLKEYTSNITIYDPWADAERVKHEYGIDIISKVPEPVEGPVSKVSEPVAHRSIEGPYDAVILAVAHKEFLDIDVKTLVKPNGVVYDVKGILPRDIVDGRL